MRALDLFCGGGGAARGILAAGFDQVVGVDINGKNRDVYPGEFIEGDALTCTPGWLRRFDFVWASPPCQAYSIALSPHCRSDHPKLIEATREMLSGHRWTCMENVPRAPLRADLVLDGAMFDLDLVRKRIFELSFPPPFALSPLQTRTVTSGGLACVAGKGAQKSWTLSRKYGNWTGIPHNIRDRLKRRNSKQGWCDAMGLPETLTVDQIREAVPPAYSEFIARAALEGITEGKSCSDRKSAAAGG